MKFNPKKYHIKTYGCQANIADATKMSAILEALGFEELIVPAEFTRREVDEMAFVFKNASVVIFNTCSVRQKSEDKVFGIGKMLKNIDKKPLIILSGCMVGSVMGDRQRYKFDVLKKKTSWVDYYLTNSEINFLPEVLKKGGWTLPEINWEKVAPKTGENKHAFVNISVGCDNFCTYCVVPYARGAEVSRSMEEILNEITHLINAGVTEITLCGQNVNSWGLSKSEKFKLRAGSNQKLPFVDLLNKLLALPELEKLDFISSNPFDFTKDLVGVLAHPKISNYIHIAVQSGNNEILEKMNRRHTVEEFVDLIKMIRSIRPNIEIGTDLIVGFPGETEKQFMDTVNLVKNIGFNVAFISMYSARQGTFAQKNYSDDISLAEKKKRHKILTDAWKERKCKKL
jgi:tRNA-2-methylthio-N6-dimethylallyladenosine synthase